MTKTIAKLWNGNLEPIRSFGKNNQEMHEIESVMQKNFEELEKALGRVSNETRTRRKAAYFGAFCSVRSRKARALLRPTETKIPRNLLALRS